MFYLKMHSIHFIYKYMVSDMWQRTIQMVREETRCCHFISSKGSFICTNPQTGEHIPLPVVEHWLERKIAQWVHHEGLIQWLITLCVNALTTELHLAPTFYKGVPPTNVPVAQIIPSSSIWRQLKHSSTCTSPWTVTLTLTNMILTLIWP